jgi:curved DNA-binding protein CbpA
MPSAADVEQLVLSAYPDLYAVLGVKSDANGNELKKAYHKRALFLHPDKNTSARATEAFKCVGTAFEVLSDEDKRSKYDAAGGSMDGLKAATEDGPSFSIVALLLGVTVWYRPRVDPDDDARFVLSVAQAEREKQAPPSRNPEPWTRRCVNRLLYVLVACVVLCVALGLDAYDRRPAKAFRFAMQPTGGLQTPATVKITVPNATAPAVKGKKRRGADKAVTTVYVRDEKTQRAIGATLPADAEAAFHRQWRTICTDALLVAQAQQLRTGMSDADALLGIPSACSGLFAA